MTASERHFPDPAPAAEPSPIDRVLDLAVYVPVGLALAARDVLPRLAEAGRRQLGAQLNAARVVGRLAVHQGTRQAGEAIRRLAVQGGAALSGTSRTRDPGAGRDGPPAPAAPPAPPPPPPPPSGHVGTDLLAAGTGRPDGGVTTAPDLDRGQVGGGADLDPAELAIPGYDTLSASQVVQRLPGLSPDELEAVRSYELAGRARKTILLKVGQLRAVS